MQPIIKNTTDDTTTQANGYVNGQIQQMNEIKGTLNNHHQQQQRQDLVKEKEERIVLPVEMACMVPLKTLVGKLVRKSFADLMTLVDTLPSMNDVEKKRQILNYTIYMRKQYLKLLVLVKWAQDANDIQQCQNIMAYLANQNKVFQDTTAHLDIIHKNLSAARLRNFDIPTAVDVLTTGTYQQMPTKIKDLLMPTPLTDKEVLETFRNLNDVIRMRMISIEVLPSPMQQYRIENGRIYFTIENEFEVALTLTGNSNDRRWWIVSLDMFVQATSAGGAAEDVDITLTEMQLQHLKTTAQRQLVPPITTTEEQSSSSLFFPLVNLYDYLHLCCLNMQLEIIYIQSAMLSKTTWMNQLQVEMNTDRTKLTLTYWQGGSPVAHWARPQKLSKEKSTVLEISVNHHQQQDQLTMTVRDELTGLIQKAGIGASVTLSNLNAVDRPKVLSCLKYPKHSLHVLWDGSNHLFTDAKLLDPSNLNAEKLVLYATSHHGACIIQKLKQVLIAENKFLEENGLYLASTTEDELSIDVIPTLVVRYRHQRYVSIEVDTRTGKVKASEASDGCSEGDANLRGLEQRLNNDPANIAQHLLWLRSEVVVREVISLAKQLNLQPYHPTHMNLRQEDLTKLFGDIQEPGYNVIKYPSHCVFFQFSQFEDWYFIIATVKNEFKSWLCCIDKAFDQNNIYQVIKDLTYLDCASLWKDQFIENNNNSSSTTRNNNKRQFSDVSEEEENTLVEEDVRMMDITTKKRRMSTHINDSQSSAEAAEAATHVNNTIDNLSIDLRYLAKLDSLCRAYITNRKIELQLQSYKGLLSYHMRPLLQSLITTTMTTATSESQIMNHPAADKMEVVCVSKKDLLKTCAYYYPHQDGTTNRRDKPMESIPWIEDQLTQLKNDVLIRSSGWWDCGRGECYVVIQDTLDWKKLSSLQGNEFGDHISLDKVTNIVSFTYPNIDDCIECFLLDWERVYMMTNVIRQISSVWFNKYKDQLHFHPTDLQTLSFTYAKDFTCTIQWDLPSKGRPRQYNIDLKIATQEKSKTKVTTLPTVHSRNPHWRIASFLRDVLNEKKDLIYFIQILFQTLPLMACLERLEVKCAQEGDIGKVSIIPRAYDSVRVIFSAMHAIDIRFTDTETICVSDAAYHHLFYSSRTTRHDTFIAPQPHLLQNITTTQQDNNDDLKPIKVAQQFKFIPFDQFENLLNDLDNWIFSSSSKQEEQDTNLQEKWYASGEPWLKGTYVEISAVSLQHGLLCSASLCQGILHKLQTMV